MKAFYLLIFMLFSTLIRAQSTTTVWASFKPVYRSVTHNVDLATATNGSFSTGALSVNSLHGLGQTHRFRIGYGLRFTAAFGRNTDYKTAPSLLVKGPGKGSALGLFARNIIENLDTLRLPKTQTNALNVSVNLEYAISHRIDIGFNIDLIGFTVGADQRGTFVADGPVRSSLSGMEQDARLTSFNILLGDQSDRGSLNSEGYVRYRFSDRISLRGGLSYIVNEYTTARPLTFDNDRFRSGNTRLLLAAAYHF